MRSEVFGIENFNILSDEENYYFFRALNMGDLRDLESGLTIEEATGAISRIRTDRSRYVGKAMYTEDSELTLEEMVHHIKMHHRTDTNCISLTSNANAAALYGRSYYKDKYAMIKVPKKELGNGVYNAGQYMVEEINRLINEYIQNNEIDELTKYYLDSIDNAQTEERLREITDSFKEKQKEDIFQRGITYKVSNATSVDYQALSPVQNLEKNKLIAKLNLLQNNLLPTISNRLLIQTLGNAFSSLELINYKEIPKEKITEVPKELIDILALIQQLPYSSKVQELKKELIAIIINKKYQTKEFTYSNNEINTTNEYTIENMYNLTNGYVDFNTAINIYKKAFYLAKSKLRTLHSIRLLSELIDTTKYQELMTYLLKNTYGVEPDVFSRQSSKKMQISESVSLDLDSKERELFEYINNKSEQELIEVLNNPTETLQEYRKHSNTLKQEYNDKNTYYANAIFDLFDWDKLDIMEISDRQRKQIIDALTKHNIIEIYNQLKQSGIKEKDIATVLLTTIIKGKKSLYIKDVFTVEELENFLGYYEINNTKGLKLRPYQATAVENIDKLHEKHNFAATVMPTGAGKSFVALTEMLKYKDEPILYLAPNETILNQIKKYILKYICPEGLKAEDGIKSENDKIKQIFPNLILSTYQSLLDDNKNEIFNPEIAKKKEKKYSLIIFDELHRTGAKEWQKSILELLKNQDSNAKILGVSATPERDMDGVDMADYWAEYFGYTEEEITLGKHIAMNMDLEEAIENGYVINPRYVQCEYMLEQDGTLASLRKEIEELMDEELKQTQLAKFDELRKRVLESAGVDEILGDNLKPGGRYIVFCPMVDNNGNVIETEDGRIENERYTGKDIIEKYQKQLILNIIKYRKLTNYSLTEKDSIEKFMKVASELGLDFYSMLGTYSKAKNRHQLSSFEQNDDPTRIKFINAINILNEGVHLDKVDGIIWLRPLDENSKILYLQQLGRIIYGLDSFEEIPEEDRPVVIDLVNNRYRVSMDKKKKTNDLDKLVIIKGWIEQNNKIPDNNSSNRVESNHGRALKRIQEKYIEYLKNPELINNLTKKEQIRIKEILRICTEIDLWSHTFEENVARKTNNKTKSVIEEDFQITGIMKDYYDLKKEVEELSISKVDAISRVKRIKTYCEETGLWVSQLTDATTKKLIKFGERTPILAEESRFLYSWLCNSGYTGGKFKYADIIDENGESLQKILDNLKKMYSKYSTPQEWVEKIKKYCEETSLWPTVYRNNNRFLGLGDEKANDLVKYSKSLYQWLVLSGYINGNFKYKKDRDENGILLKTILDDLYNKYAIKEKTPLDWIHEINTYCEETGMWPLADATDQHEKFVKFGEQAKEIARKSRSLGSWLKNYKYNSEKFVYAEMTDENGVTFQEILDSLKVRIKELEIIKIVKQIKEYCEETKMWPSCMADATNEEFLIFGDKASILAKKSRSLYNWLSSTKYFAGKFKHEDIIDENGQTLQEILDKLKEMTNRSSNTIMLEQQKKRKRMENPPQDIVKRIKEHCEVTGMWLSTTHTLEDYSDLDMSIQEKEEMIKNSKTFYYWLKNNGYIGQNKKFKYAKLSYENGVTLQETLDEIKKKMDEKVIIKKVNEIKEYCEKTQLWPSGKPQIEDYGLLEISVEEKKKLAKKSASLYEWLCYHGYIKGEFDYEKIIGENGETLKVILDDLKDKYSYYDPPQKWVEKIIDYCEKTELWPSNSVKVEDFSNLELSEKEKTELVITSKSLYSWLTTTSKYVSGSFKYKDSTDENGILLKTILDDLKVKMEEKEILRKVNEIKIHCEKTQLWPSGSHKKEEYLKLNITETEAIDLLKQSRNLYYWLKNIGYINNEVIYDKKIGENGETLKDILDNLRTKYAPHIRPMIAPLEQVKKIKSFCEETGLWPSLKADATSKEFARFGEQAKNLAEQSQYFYNWLRWHGYFTNEFKKTNSTDENDMLLQDVLDSLKAIYFRGNSTELTTADQHYNLKKSSTSKNLLSKLYYLVVQLDLSYKSNDTEKFDSFYSQINEIITKNNLNIDINKIQELITLDEDKKYELCLSEYMHSSIQNNLDNAELYKALYNYYSVLRYGVNTLTSDIKL